VLDWREREARNQSVFRELNEWIRDENETRFGADRRLDRYLCECGDGACTCSISLTGHEYETVRTSPTMFAIAINHENPESDHVVSENPRFATIETCFGEARLIALASNPRS
jgi:hypothetical protein